MAPLPLSLPVDLRINQLLEFGNAARPSGEAIAFAEAIFEFIDFHQQVVRFCA
jgi:hypothetical protein